MATKTVKVKCTSRSLLKR